MKLGYRVQGIGFIILLIMVLTSCASFKAQAPNNFAEYDDTSSNIFKAISPDGVLYRVTAYEQESQATTEFWREAFLLKMKNANYKQEEALNIKVNGQPVVAYIFSFANSAGSDLYLVVAIPHKKEMIVVEATAESAKFNARKADILNAIGKINFN